MPSPAEALCIRLQARGYNCVLTSTVRNRYLRFLDILRTVLLRCATLDVLCLQVYGGASFVVEDATSWIARRLGLPVVMVLHGGAMPEFMARYPGWSRRVLSRAQVLVSPSSFLAQAVRDHGFAARVVPNALNLVDYDFRERREIRPRLFWMRAFHDIYNPQMAIDVLAAVREQAPYATLTMAGQDSGLLMSLQNLVEARRLGGVVRFAGFLESSGKRKEFASHDVFLNTNRIDNTPVSVVEALASGLPVVATEVGGIPYLLSHGETALLVADDDAPAMARAIVRLLREPELTSQLSIAGRKFAERCDWSNVLHKWQNVFAEVMGNR